MQRPCTRCWVTVEDLVVSKLFEVFWDLQSGSANARALYPVLSFVLLLDLDLTGMVRGCKSSWIAEI